MEFNLESWAMSDRSWCCKKALKLECPSIAVQKRTQSCRRSSCCCSISFFCIADACSCSSYLFCCFSPLPFKSLNAKFMLKSLIKCDMDMGNFVRHTNVHVLCTYHVNWPTKTSATFQVFPTMLQMLSVTKNLLIQENYKNILWNAAQAQIS